MNCNIRQITDPQTRAELKLNSILVLPHETVRDEQYWLALEKRYPTGNLPLLNNPYLKLQNNLIGKLLETLPIIYDNTIPDTKLIKAVRWCSDRLCAFIKPTYDLPIGSLEMFGRIDDYFGNYSSMLIILKIPEELQGPPKFRILPNINPLNKYHVAMVMKSGDGIKYKFFDPAGYIVDMENSYKNIINFVGDHPITRDYVEKLRIRSEEHNTLNIDPLNNTSDKNFDLKVEQAASTIDEFRRALMKLIGTQNIFLRSKYFDDSCLPIQGNRPVCFFWSFLRSLHPEKTAIQFSCMIQKLKRSENLPETFSNDLLAISIIEHFIESGPEHPTNINAYRSQFGGKKYKRKNKTIRKKKRTLLF